MRQAHSVGNPRDADCEQAMIRDGAGEPMGHVASVWPVHPMFDGSSAFCLLSPLRLIKDGKGLNLVLSALPINGRLVLREYTSEDEKRDAEKGARTRKK